MKQSWWKLMAEKTLLPHLQGDCSSKIRRYSSSGFQSVFIFSLQNQVRYTFSHYMIFLTLDYIRWIKERNNTCIFQKIWRMRNLCHSVNWLVAKNSGQLNAWRNSASQSPLFYLFTPLTKLHHWYASRLTIMGFFYRLPFVCFNVKIKHYNYSIIIRLYL